MSSESGPAGSTPDVPAHCASCGNGLDGRGLEDDCPVCGTPVRISARVPRHRPVRDGVRCTGCGYALRGLTTEDRCPECGLPVQSTTLRPVLDVVRRSMRGKPAPTRRRRLLRAGAALLLVVIALWLLYRNG